MEYVETPETEQKYDELHKLGVDLGVPIPHAFLEIQVADKDCNIVYAHKQRSHSYVRNFYNILLAHTGHCDCDSSGVFGAGYMNYKDTGGTVRGNANQMRMMQANESQHTAAGTSVRAGDGTVTYGIVVGTSNDAEDFEDYVLTTPVADGTGAGQLEYLDMAVAPVLGYVAGTKTFSVSWRRDMHNADTSALEIKEIAIYCVCTYGASVASAMLSRDVVATITVPAGGFLYITYTTSLVYPA